VSDIDTAAADSLKALDPKRPIREADITRTVVNLRPRPCHASLAGGNRRRRPPAAVEVRPAPGLVEVDAKISAEPRKPLKPRSLYVIFLVAKDIRVNDGNRI
jgi:hypothetical protein